MPAKLPTITQTSGLVEVKRTSLKQGAILNWLSLGLNFCASFVLTPIIIHRLGALGFGMWALIQSFSGYYGLVNLGLASALQRFVSRDLNKGNLISLQQTVGTAVSFFSVTGLLVLMAALFLRGSAAHFFDIPAVDVPAFGKTLLLCATAVVADFYGALITTLFTARERFDLSNGLSIVRQILQTAGILVVLQIHPSINGIAAVVCCVSIVAVLAGWLIVISIYPAIVFTWRGAQFARLKDLLHYGTSTVLITISNIVRLRLGNMVIAKTADLASVGVFSLASSLIISMNTAMSSSLNVLNPRFTRLHSQDDLQELQRIYRTSLFFSSTLACGTGLLMLLFGERFILFWVGERFVSAAPILSVLTVAYTVSHAQAPGWNLMFALAKHHYMARVTSIEAVLIVVLGYWLSRTHGALGYAWATAACMLFTKIFLQPSYAAGIASLTLTEYLVPMVVPFAVSGGILAFAEVLNFPHFLRQHDLLIFLCSAASCATVYLILVMAFTRGRDYIPVINFRMLARRKRS